MINKTLFILALTTVLLSACNQNIKPSALYGKWKYIKLDHPKNDAPSDTLTSYELNAADPYISFTAKNELMISWEGKIISHGSFTTDAHNINYTEQLPDGSKRTFPFFISKLDDKTIVFETLDKKDAVRVTAVKN
jgi:hypothetical protein